MPHADRRTSRAGEEVEEATILACRAAEQGDWDTVERWVNRRGELLDQAVEPPVPASRLVDLDMRIHDLAMTAKAAVAAMLTELGRTRRNVRRLQQGNQGQEPEKSRFMNVTA